MEAIGNRILEDFELVELAATVGGKPQRFFFAFANEEEQEMGIKFEEKFKVSILFFFFLLPSCMVTQ